MKVYCVFHRFQTGFFTVEYVLEKVFHTESDAAAYVGTQTIPDDWVVETHFVK